MVFRAGFCQLLHYIRFPKSFAHKQDVLVISAENWGVSTTDRKKVNIAHINMGPEVLRHELEPFEGVPATAEIEL
jgi:hypothetical protein